MSYLIRRVYFKRRTRRALRGMARLRQEELVNETEHKNWELVVDDVWDNEQRMTPEKRDAILAADDCLQALEAAAAGFDPAGCKPDFDVPVLAQERGKNRRSRCIAAWDGDRWWLWSNGSVSLQVDRWWPLPGAALDGDAERSET